MEFLRIYIFFLLSSLNICTEKHGLTFTHIVINRAHTKLLSCAPEHKKIQVQGENKVHMALQESTTS